MADKKEKDLETEIRKILDQQAKHLPPGYFVEGNRIYRLVLGGESVEIGYVKNGIPYRKVYGGPDKPIGRYLRKRYK